MRIKNKIAWGTLLVWTVLMIASYFIFGLSEPPDILMYGWFNLIAAGLLILACQKVYPLLKPQKISEKQSNLYEGVESFITAERLYKEKKYSEALEYFDRAIECGYGDESYFLRANCLQECGFHIEAIKDYNNAISLKPNDCNLYYMRSLSKSETGDDEGALEDVQDAIRLSKYDNELNRNYSANAIHLGWGGGHTALYESTILDIQSDIGRGEAYRRKRQQENTRYRNEAP